MSSPVSSHSSSLSKVSSTWSSCRLFRLAAVNTDFNGGRASHGKWTKHGCRHRTRANNVYKTIDAAPCPRSAVKVVAGRTTDRRRQPNLSIGRLEIEHVGSHLPELDAEHTVLRSINPDVSKRVLDCAEHSGDSQYVSQNVSLTASVLSKPGVSSRTSVTASSIFSSVMSTIPRYMPCQRQLIICPLAVARVAPSIAPRPVDQLRRHPGSCAMA